MSKINKTFGIVRKSGNSLIVSLDKDTVKEGDKIELAYRIYEQEGLEQELCKINKTIDSKINKTETNDSQINKTEGKINKTEINTSKINLTDNSQINLTESQINKTETIEESKINKTQEEHKIDPYMKSLIFHKPTITR